MHKVKRTCPICKQNGKDTTLELRQINLTEAVYICEDRNCIYPIGFQWEYVRNDILEDSDESSDDSIKLTSDKKVSNSSNPQINTDSSYTNSIKLLHEKYRNITIAKTPDSKEKINIIGNVVIQNPELLRSITNKKDNVKTNDIFIRSTESIRKNNVRNKTKTQHISGAIPKSVVKNAKALSEYFSSTTNQSRKPKTTIKSVFDIIQQPPVKKQYVSTTKLKKSEEEILSDQAIIENTSIEHNYSMKQENFQEVLENAISNEQVELNNEPTDSFDELLFSNEDKCDTTNQSLDLSEMDELLSFL